QPVGWFAPGSPETVVPRRFPIFILDRGPDDMVYGFPDFEQRGEWRQCATEPWAQRQDRALGEELFAIRADRHAVVVRHEAR
ncbi:hypothetical protein G8O24_43715, partial [Bradyrhizobium sp. INPA01-394B]|nr:hypothetical protein [Bradyrhizobium campsiandrae]